MVNIVTFEIGGESVSKMLDTKTFKTGNTGYGAYDKVEINGERFQLSLNLVRLKTK